MDKIKGLAPYESMKKVRELLDEQIEALAVELQLCTHEFDCEHPVGTPGCEVSYVGNRG
jgi:hypothetical protein